MYYLILLQSRKLLKTPEANPEKKTWQSVCLSQYSKVDINCPGLAAYQKVTYIFLDIKHTIPRKYCDTAYKERLPAQSSTLGRK